MINENNTVLCDFGYHFLSFSTHSVIYMCWPGCTSVWVVNVYFTGIKRVKTDYLPFSHYHICSARKRAYRGRLNEVEITRAERYMRVSGQNSLNGKIPWYFRIKSRWSVWYCNISEVRLTDRGDTVIFLNEDSLSGVMTVISSRVSSLAGASEDNSV